MVKHNVGSMSKKLLIISSEVWDMVYTLAEMYGAIPSQLFESALIL